MAGLTISQGGKCCCGPPYCEVNCSGDVPQSFGWKLTGVTDGDCTDCDAREEHGLGCLDFHGIRLLDYLTIDGSCVWSGRSDGCEKTDACCEAEDGDGNEAPPTLARFHIDIVNNGTDDEYIGIFQWVQGYAGSDLIWGGTWSKNFGASMPSCSDVITSSYTYDTTRELVGRTHNSICNFSSSTVTLQPDCATRQLCPCKLDTNPSAFLVEILYPIPDKSPFTNCGWDVKDWYLGHKDNGAYYLYRTTYPEQCNKCEYTYSGSNTHGDTITITLTIELGPAWDDYTYTVPTEGCGVYYTLAWDSRNSKGRSGRTPGAGVPVGARFAGMRDELDCGDIDETLTTRTPNGPAPHSQTMYQVYMSQWPVSCHFKRDGVTGQGCRRNCLIGSDFESKGCTFPPLCPELPEYDGNWPSTPNGTVSVTAIA